MARRVKQRGKIGAPAEQGFAAYLRVLTLVAVLAFPFWLALPFVVKTDRLALFLSLPTWKQLVWLACVVFVSFLSSASIEWDDRRREAKFRRR